MARICRLEQAVGRTSCCAEMRCVFWEPGGAVLEGRCAFDHLDLGLHDELAAELLRVREQLESLDPHEAHMRHLFYRLLNESDD